MLKTPNKIEKLSEIIRQKIKIGVYRIGQKPKTEQDKWKWKTLKINWEK